MKRKSALRKNHSKKPHHILSGDEIIIIFGGFLVIMFILLSLSGSYTSNTSAVSTNPTPTYTPVSTY